MSNKIFTSPDKCGTCPQYIPGIQGCHRLSNGLSCVKEDKVESIRDLAEATSAANLRGALDLSEASSTANLKVALSHPSFVPPAPKSAFDVQVGGSHYKHMEIQPVEFITRNNLGFLEGCVVKRMCRWRNKNGVEDLEKAIHEIQLLIEMEKVRTP
jgi:hypothetical protein